MNSDIESTQNDEGIISNPREDSAVPSSGTTEETKPAKRKRAPRKVAPRAAEKPKAIVGVNNHLNKLKLIEFGKEIPIRELVSCQVRSKIVDVATKTRYVEMLEITEPPNITVICTHDGKLLIPFYSQTLNK